MSTSAAGEIALPVEMGELRLGEQVLELPIRRATAGQAAVDVGSLLKDGARDHP